MNASERKRKWRRENPEKCRNENQRYYGKSQDAENKRAEWPAEHILAIIIPERPVDHKLSAMIGRSVMAIQIKRSRLKSNN